MELNINSPVYYKDHYGIDNEVYRFCQRAYVSFKDREYSGTLRILGILPIAAPEEVWAERNYREKVKFLCGRSFASVEIKLDLEAYRNADSAERIRQTKEMILTAVRRIKGKVDFDYDRFQADLMKLR